MPDRGLEAIGDCVERGLPAQSRILVNLATRNDSQLVVPEPELHTYLPMLPPFRRHRPMTSQAPAPSEAEHASGPGGRIA